MAQEAEYLSRQLSCTGNFFHLFDWNRKSRVLHHKSLPAERPSPRQHQESMDSFTPETDPILCHNLIDYEQKEDIHGALTEEDGIHSDEPCLEKKCNTEFANTEIKTPEKHKKKRTPNIVAKLMGLETMPPMSPEMHKAHVSEINSDKLKNTYEENDLSLWFPENAILDDDKVPLVLLTKLAAMATTADSSSALRSLLLPNKLHNRMMISPVKSPLATKAAACFLEAASKILEPNMKRKTNPNPRRASTPLSTQQRNGDLKTKKDVAKQVPRPSKNSKSATLSIQKPVSGQNKPKQDPSKFRNAVTHPARFNGNGNIAGNRRANSPLSRSNVNVKDRDKSKRSQKQADLKISSKSSTVQRSELKSTNEKSSKPSKPVMKHESSKPVKSNLQNSAKATKVMATARPVEDSDQLSADSSAVSSIDQENISATVSRKACDAEVDNKVQSRTNASPLMRSLLARRAAAIAREGPMSRNNNNTKNNLSKQNKKKPSVKSKKKDDISNRHADETSCAGSDDAKSSCTTERTTSESLCSAVETRSLSSVRSCLSSIEDLEDTASSYDPRKKQSKTSVSYSGKSTNVILKELLNALSPNSSTNDVNETSLFELRKRIDCQDSAKMNPTSMSYDSFKDMFKVSIEDCSEDSSISSFLSPFNDDSSMCSGISFSCTQDITSSDHESVDSMARRRYSCVGYVTPKTTKIVFRSEEQYINYIITNSKLFPGDIYSARLKLSAPLVDPSLFHELEEAMEHEWTWDNTPQTNDMYIDDEDLDFFSSDIARSKRKLVFDCLREAVNLEMRTEEHECQESCTPFVQLPSSVISKNALRQIHEWRSIDCRMNVDDLVEKGMNTGIGKWDDFSNEVCELAVQMGDSILEALIEELVRESSML